jgi:CRISPR-associated protein Cas1
MPVLYVTEQNATLRLSGESLVVTVEEHEADGHGAGRRRIVMEVEPHRLELVALVGRVHVTSDATLFCLEKGIAVAWLTRGGELLGRVVPPLPRSADVRIAQYEAVRDPSARLDRARGVVSAKLENALEVLRDIQSNDPDNGALSPAMTELKRLCEAVAACPAVERLLGLEGTGARTYFSALGSAFKAGIGFVGRKHRPPPDPANALLSFGYVLLGNRVAGLIEARGLDPCLGFFHEVRSGRPSLAVDMLEELRHPVVDRFVLRGCNLRIFREELFEPPDEDGGVRLTRDGLKVFFEHWEGHLQKPMREKDAEGKIAPLELLRRQVERLAASLRGKGPYAPFRYGG